MSTAQPIRQACEKMTSLVHTARRLLHDGRRVDLSILTDRIGEICTDVARLPEREARTLVPILERLQDALDTLAHELPTFVKDQHGFMPKA